MNGVRAVVDNRGHVASAAAIFERPDAGKHDIAAICGAPIQSGLREEEEERLFIMKEQM